MYKSVIIPVLIAACAAVLPQRVLLGRERCGIPGLEYGVEWGLQMPVVTKLDCSFLTTDRYRVTLDEIKVGNHFNGMFSAYVGYEALERVTMSLSVGYAGLTKGERGVFSTLRGTYRISSQSGDGDAGSRIFAEGGIFGRKGHRISAIAKTGYGYRAALSRSLALDIRCGVMTSRSHPDVYDIYSGCTVSRKNLRSLRNVNMGPFLTLAVTFF